MSDSDDDIIASLEEPITQSIQSHTKSQENIPSEAKKTKIHNDSDCNLSDNSLLANISIPELRINAITGSATTTSSTTTVTPASSSSSSTSAQSRIPPATRNINRNNCVLVHSKQRGNPILKSIINVPWEFEDGIYADYVVGATAGILFLSLRYHQLNPDYIHGRLKDIGKRYELRILLVLVDTKVLRC